MSKETPPEGLRKDRSGLVVKANWVIAIVIVSLLVAGWVLYASLRAAR